MTRPLPAAQRFARMLRRAGATDPILFSPIIRIELTGQGALPAGTLVFTSENGVHAAAAMGALVGRDVIAVGPRTAASARAQGARVTVGSGDVQTLAEMLIAQAGGPFVHLHGAHVTGDLVGNLRAAGLQAAARVIYNQTPHALTEAARNALKSDRPSVLPLFSAKSAEWVAQDLAEQPSKTLMVALSAQVRESWPWSGAALVAERTEIGGMCAAVMQAVSGRTGEGE
ncbi:uroporphyrinogen-III synthase [Palleronia sp. THAF1]|uniref:uroporphyrinogen-III synthase n=1 Tax=Palleronia sp. THAF1 TaxID=2587842 RepID=UPI0015624DA6|nr:uroporphyrinogen-III synthase [Palleronia sp. THAF1]